MINEGTAYIYIPNTTCVMVKMALSKMGFDSEDLRVFRGHEYCEVVVGFS